MHNAHDGNLKIQIITGAYAGFYKGGLRQHGYTNIILLNDTGGPNASGVGRSLLRLAEYTSGGGGGENGESNRETLAFRHI